jgi:hypothetical protein
MVLERRIKMGRMKELWEERRLQDQEEADYGAHDSENYEEESAMLRVSIVLIKEELEKIYKDLEDQRGPVKSALIGDD